MSSHSSAASWKISEPPKSPTECSIEWLKPIKNILIVHKETDLEMISEKLFEISEWLTKYFNGRSAALDLIGVYPSILEESLCFKPEFCVKFFNSAKDIPKEIDLAITLGGDGTVLLAAWLFQDEAPPILPFHFGTLGFLTVFNWENFENRISSIIENGCKFNNRIRLNCQVFKKARSDVASFNVLNEIVIERGASPFMSILDFYGDGTHLTKVQADGVAIATPTGSTAYSLSAGGSVVHPEVKAILVTPICPHSLSFRPLIVPESIELKIVVSDSNRGNVWVSFDGRSRIELEPGDHLIIRPSLQPIYTICRDNKTSDWFNSLSTCLHWNKR